MAIADFISSDEESDLLVCYRTLDFSPFQYLQYTAQCRVVVYRRDYDFTSPKTSTTAPITEHSIPVVKEMRYSGTPRTLRARKQK